MSSSRIVDIESVLSNPRYYKFDRPSYTKNSKNLSNDYEYDNNWAKSKRSSSNLNKVPYQEQKQNFNSLQTRQFKYVKPARSSLKQAYKSPLKLQFNERSNNSFGGRLSNKKPKFEQGQPFRPVRSENINSCDNSKYGQYKMNTSRCYNNPVSYDTHSRYQQPVYEENRPHTARSNYQSTMMMTFSNRNNEKRETTPKKQQIEIDELVQKSQFLRQKIQRINRMTPKASKNRNEKSVSVTPQKIPEKSLSKQLFGNNIIVKHNKYCDEVLPLQTIYDADEHRLDLKDRQPTEQTEQGLQKINCLSKKISQRLKQIISRHS